MTDLLMETPLSYDQQDLAKTVMSSAGSLLNIIDDILDFSKIEAGKIELEEIDFDLLEVVESVSSILAPKAHDKNLAFFLITPPEMPNQYLGDPVRLRQIIINLTNNAIKFTHQGEIALSVYQEGEEGDLARLRFSVRDTGIGIPEDRLNRLFKSFSQVDSSVTRQYGGTGLGLAISKSLAELMGGEIGVNSIEGEGSEFWFTVRLRKSPEPRAVAFDFSFLSGHRILITDDHPVSRQLLLDHLKNSPAAVQAAENGVEAWDLLKAAETAGEPFTICIADFGIPGMTGEELVMKIRGDSRLQSLKTMLITASVGRADLQRIIRAGFDTYLMKPVTGRRLRAGLSKMLGHETVSATEPGKAILAFPRQNGEEIRLLLVEDNLVNRKVAQKMLEKMGFEVDVAGDGLEALQAVENTRYDLIFMDIQMPRMDGLSATRSIRDWQSDAAVPIIALTANAMKGDREKCLAAGMDGYISKPFKKAELTAVLNRFLS
ncbi:MAG: response regulator [Calditrichaeota bacterium]|nr:response regulator [Calditrichota bacterium]